MLTLNTQVRIQSRTGSNISTVSLSNFWNGMPGASGTLDPYMEKWVFVAVSGSSSSSSKVMEAVSQTDDPTGGWNRYTIDSDPNNTGWLDYPSIGFNKKWLVVTGNMFSNGGNYQNNAFFVISLQDLYDGISNAQYTRIEYNPSFTIVPALTYDEELEDIYLISNYSAGFTSKYKISGDIGTEVFELEGFISNTNG